MKNQAFVYNQATTSLNNLNKITVNGVGLEQINYIQKLTALEKLTHCSSYYIYYINISKRDC